MALTLPRFYCQLSLLACLCDGKEVAPDGAGAGMTKEQFAAQLDEVMGEQAGAFLQSGRLDSLWDEITQGVAAQAGRGDSSEGRRQPFHPSDPRYDPSRDERTPGGRKRRPAPERFVMPSGLRWFQLGALALSALLMWLTRRSGQSLARLKAMHASETSGAGTQTPAASGADRSDQMAGKSSAQASHATKGGKGQ